MMIQKEIEKFIKSALKELGFVQPKEISLEHPENPEHGDYATNVALIIAKQLQKNPQEIAEMIKSKIQNSKSLASRDRAQPDKIIERVEAVNRFVNFFLSREYLWGELNRIAKEKETYGASTLHKGKNIMVEYAHPNTHKEMHIGHMRTLITGEALARIFQANGARVFRANYQGDIGPHVAKALWGTQKILQEQAMSWDDAERLNLAEKAHLLGQGYVRGTQAYENHKQEVDELNAKLYRKDRSIMSVYRRTRKWSLDYYKELYHRFGTKFNKLYFESESAEPGKNIVLENLDKVFEKSEGAIIFNGEIYGLHKRVFVTKEGNPTYEAKDIGLAPLQYKDFPFDLNIHVVANEQSGYFQVVFKALELVDKKFKGRQYHLPMGMVQLVGKKMSSRTGVVITVDGLLQEVKNLLENLITNKELTLKEKNEVLETCTIAAVKYSVLKTDTKSNVMFDLARSVALDGNSGPYLLYTYARCRSILRKAHGEFAKTLLLRSSRVLANLSAEELVILRTMYKFPEVVQEAAAKYAPNLVCSFVFDLAQKYNLFYNTHPVLQAEIKEQKEFRLLLTFAVAQLIQNSLYLLGIQTLEKM